MRLRLRHLTGTRFTLHWFGKLPELDFPSCQLMPAHMDLVQYERFSCNWLHGQALLMAAQRERETIFTTIAATTWMQHDLGIDLDLALKLSRKAFLPTRDSGFLGPSFPLTQRILRIDEASSMILTAAQIAAIGAWRWIFRSTLHPIRDVPKTSSKPRLLPVEL